jgi:hypothetical protein
LPAGNQSTLKQCINNGVRLLAILGAYLNLETLIVQRDLILDGPEALYVDSKDRPTRR